MLAKQLLQVLGYRDGLFEQLADAVKDAILDWELSPSSNGDPADDLLPMSPPLFVEAVRPRMEEALRQLAVAINDMPPDQASDLLKGPAARLFVDVLREAVLIGVQMRVEATEASLTSTQLPQGDWAKRYRQMRAAKLAPNPTPDEDPTPVPAPAEATTLPGEPE